MTGFLGALIYNIGIFLYALIIRVAALFKPKARLFMEGRRDIFNRIREELKDNAGPNAWFHCASLGEFEQARPVIEAFRKKHPQYRIIVTFFSPSGYEVRKNDQAADHIFYLPLDTASNARRLIKLFRPSVAFFVKYEFWHHYLDQLRRQQVPVYLISAHFREDQVFFAWYGTFFRNMLQVFDRIFTQNEGSEALLRAIGIDRVTVSRDTRFDRVYDSTVNAPLLPLIEQFRQNQPLLVAGSSYATEETMIGNYLVDHPRLKVIIAPHEIHASRISEVLDTFKDHKTMRYSEANAQNVQDAEVLVIDNIGLLAAIYRYADIAFVGGGFGKKGLHNTLEAATFGMPILFGPNNHDKFPEARQLLQNGIAFTIPDQEAFSQLMEDLLHYPAKRKEIGLRSRNFIQAHIGATATILSHIRA